MLNRKYNIEKKQNMSSIDSVSEITEMLELRPFGAL